MEELHPSPLVTQETVAYMVRLNQSYEAFASSLLCKSPVVYDTPTLSCEDAVATLEGKEATAVVMDGIEVNTEVRRKLTLSLVRFVE